MIDPPPSKVYNTTMTMTSSNIDQTSGDGPDASSLKPVSSIRARFENMGRDAPVPTPPAPIPTKPPSRPISPAPKPDKLRTFQSTQDITTGISTITTPTPTPTTPVVPSRPKPKVVPFVRQQEVEAASPTVTPLNAGSTTAPPPILLTRPASGINAQGTAATPPPPPAVMVQPPQSPPKGRISSLAVGEHPMLLDSVASPAASHPSASSISQNARPTTPTPAAPSPRSPRPARPPSPPPPRRSAEIGREKREPPPPPAPRREKIPPRDIPNNAHQQSTQRNIADETSPFSSPPSSPGDEEAPQLPSRLRQVTLAERAERIERVERPRQVLEVFDPPPVHPATLKRRAQRESEMNGIVGSGPGPGSSPLVEESRQPNSRLQPAEGSSRPLSFQPPPRPPRPVPAGPQHGDPQSQVPSKRITSNPAQGVPLPPPTRAIGRSKTVSERERVPMESRTSQGTVAPSPAPKPTKVTGVTPKTEPAAQVVTYPDCSSTNRRPPFMKHGVEEIQTKYDARFFDVCGENVCTSGPLTRVWNLLDGDMIMSLSHTEGIRATAVAFKPAADPREEGWKVWIGTSTGELMEVDVATHGITNSRGSVHNRREIIKIYRHYNELWTLDEQGTLLVWGPDETGVPNVTGNPHQSFRLPREHTFSLVVGSELWHAAGKELRVYAPSLDGHTPVQVLSRPLIAEGAGEISSGCLVKTQPGKVFFGHGDGKVSIYSTTDYSSLGVLNISTWKMSSLAGVGHRIWVGYNTGRMCVYDISEAPWTILKEWQAHSNPIIGLKSDPASAYKLDRLQVVSLGSDNKVKPWDGLLEDDWIEDEMKSKDTEYCDFDEIQAMVFTWNAGASTPNSLRYSHNDGVFFPELIQASGSPDLLIFGFQELVDLEDKTATAKRFLKVKKKKDEGSDQERMSHQYRDWRDFLTKTIDDYMPGDDIYHLLHTAPMVGLFTCVFVKASIRDRIKHLSGAEVKRGMGGLHGNKGAIVVRFRIDDTSLCFVNCHLAAGQSQANARHNDIAEILEASLFTEERDPASRIDSFAGGGDGTMILDHELCIINGDLNYRIDTMSRDTVVTAVKQNNLAKLLERDQLLVARRRNPAFRLRAFEELPITFAPTYKYDVGTDVYDTSEKRRSPAWCDRLLFRGRGRVQQLDYRRHEVYVSDHRPVTGNFRLWVKKVKRTERSRAWVEGQRSFEVVRERETNDEKLHYLMAICGFDEATSKRLIKEGMGRKSHRSPSRNRDLY